MTPEDHPSRFMRQPAFPPPYGNPQRQRSAAPETAILTRQLQIERKSFMLSLKENERGRMLRITEEAGGRYNGIIIPVTGLKDFQRLVDEMVKTAGEIPEKGPPSANNP